MNNCPLFDNPLTVLPGKATMLRHIFLLTHQFIRHFARNSMAGANNKTIIGLTGNIAAGKSVVRKMLEHLGAYTIDADSLSHRVMEKDGPAYQPTVDQFGKFILDDGGRIDRTKLGKVVFADPGAMQSLEQIIHPYVRQAVDYLISHASQDVIVIEAIKLLESPLLEHCETIWVVTTSEKNQLNRLMTKRGMNEGEARQRMKAQSPQALKAAQADVLIKNDDSIEDTWKQVQAGWNQLFASTPGAVIEEHQVSAAAPTAPGAELASADLYAERAKPGQAQAIADLINKLSGKPGTLSRIDIMTTFGEKAYMLLLTGDQLVGVMGWQVENLIAQIDEVWLEPTLNLPGAIKILLEDIEEAAKQLQAEAALAFVPKRLESQLKPWSDQGFEPRTPEQFTVNAWREAAEQNQHPETLLLFKQLRVDRVLRPL
jgi:dephospho-CoA kinase